MPSPLPPVARPERNDFAAFAELDRVLSEAVTAARNSSVAADAARTVRVVAGLRAIRALRPPVGFPYFFDAAPSFSPPTPPREDGSMTVSPRSSPHLRVNGPRLLHVWVRDEGEASVDAELRVLEGERVRGTTDL